MDMQAGRGRGWGRLSLCIHTNTCIPTPKITSLLVIKRHKFKNKETMIARRPFILTLYVSTRTFLLVHIRNIIDL